MPFHGARTHEFEVDMGKQRNQMARIHGNKRRKAREQVKEFRSGKRTGEDLNRLARMLLRKSTVVENAKKKAGGSTAKPAAAAPSA